MQFYDCGATYHRPDIFGSLSPADIMRFDMTLPQRRIPFVPVVTKPDYPISIAFVGLNAYCGDDYQAAFKQPNFTEWCQARYGQKIFTVLDLFAQAQTARGLPSGAFYFTNYFKIVLPEHLFKGEQAAVNGLKIAPSVAHIFDASLRREIEDLAAGGCRGFVSFGNWSARYFEQIVGRHFGGMSPTKTPGISQFSVYPHVPLYFVHERHYSFYAKNKTLDLSVALAKYLKDGGAQ